jgi:hypothetical protein
MDYLFDCNRLMEKYGLSQIKTALLNLRIRPGQKFFPRPDEIAEELERMEAEAKADALKANPYVPDPTCNHVGDGKYGLRRFVDKDGDFCTERCSCWNRWKSAGQPAVADHKARAAGE